MKKVEIVKKPKPKIRPKIITMEMFLAQLIGGRPCDYKGKDFRWFYESKK